MPDRIPTIEYFTKQVILQAREQLLYSVLVKIDTESTIALVLVFA